MTNPVSDNGYYSNYVYQVPIARERIVTGPPPTKPFELKTPENTQKSKEADKKKQQKDKEKQSSSK